MFGQLWLRPSSGAAVSWWLGLGWQILEHLEASQASLSIHRVSELLLVLCPHSWFGLPYCTAASGQTGYFPQGCLPSEGASQESRADRHGPDLIQRLHFQQYCFDHWTQSCLRSLIQFEFIFVHGVS